MSLFQVLFAFELCAMRGNTHDLRANRLRSLFLFLLILYAYSMISFCFRMKVEFPIDKSQSRLLPDYISCYVYCYGR